MRLSAPKSAALLAGVLAAGAACEEAACAAKGPARRALHLLQRRARATGADLQEEGRRLSPLCGDGVVEEACADFRDDHDSLPDGRISREMAMDGLSVNASMVGALWGVLGFGANASVACANLCQAAVQYLGKRAQLPPSNDKACYRTASGAGACDLDVSLGQLQKIRFDGDLPNHHGDDRAMSLLASQALRQVARARRRSGEGARSLGSSPHVLAEPVSHTLDTLVERLANAFRIYPVFTSAATLGAGPLASEPACMTRAARVTQKAKAWVNTAISKVKRRETRPQMRKWFGADTLSTRREVLRVLNSIDAVMADFRYVLLPKGPETCDGDTYAFVMHDGIARCSEATLPGAECQTDAAGRKVVYLCELYCRSSENVQVETLTHESSHHLPADTNDVPPEPYGRQWCLRMARKRPQDAVRNADNYCFYVNDVVLGLGGGAGSPGRCPSAASGRCDATPCACGGDQVKVGKRGCFQCAVKCPSAESWSCGDSHCRCGTGEWRAEEDGCFYCERDDW